MFWPRSRSHDKSPGGGTLRSPANSQHQLVSLVSEPSLQQICKPETNLQMTPALADILAVTSQETLSQNFPDEPPSHS